MADTAPAPKALPERLAELINRLNNGDIKVPAFQRGFIWKPGQVIDLLDSVYRGYPIGSLLFWRTEESLAAERDMGDFQLPETPEKYPRNYILDGQQRLTAVYGVLTFAGDSSSDSQFNVSFDFDGDRFVTGPPPEFTVVMPMNVLFDTKKFIAFQRQLEEDDRSDLLDATVRLYDRFHEYQVPVVTVQDLPIESVAVIFERINSTGTKLTMLDLMVAATWSQDFDLRDALEDVIDVLTKKSYDGINPTAVLQVLSAVTGSSVSRDAIYGLRTMSPGDLTAHVSVVEQALRRSVDFLSTQLHVKTDDFLPYERQLVALGYIFSKHKTLTAAQSQNLHDGSGEHRSQSDTDAEVRGSSTRTSHRSRRHWPTYRSSSGLADHRTPWSSSVVSSGAELR